MPLNLMRFSTTSLPLLETCATYLGTCSECARLPLLRSEEHTSELQSRFDLVCRLLLEKKKYTYNTGDFDAAFRLRLKLPPGLAEPLLASDVYASYLAEASALGGRAGVTLTTNVPPQPV